MKSSTRRLDIDTELNMVESTTTNNFNISLAEKPWDAKSFGH